METHRFSPEFLFGTMNVEEGSYPHQQPPPRPVPHQHELSDVALDASDSQILEFSLL